MAKYTAQEINDLIEKSAERAVEKAVERSSKHTDTAIERAAKNTDKVIEIAIGRAVGAYDENMKHHIGLVLESTGFIRERLQDMVTRDEFNGLKDEVKLIRLATTATNRDLLKLAKRTTRLEETVYHD